MEIGLVTLGLILCPFIYLVLSKWNEIRYNTKGLPPGTLGWPLLGESIAFLKEGPRFLRKKKVRYGSVIKSHVLGSPTVVSMDPELNRYILLNEARGLIPGYPQSHRKILGRSNIATVDGATHKRLRGAILALVGPAMMKDYNLLCKIDKNTRSFTDHWEGRTLDIQEKTKEMAFLIAFKQIVELESDSMFEAVEREFNKLARGVLSLPINIPGTQYYHGTQARQEIINIVKQILKERRASSVKHDDMLYHLMNDEFGSCNLNDEEITDQIITLLYSGYETVSTTTMMAIKYLNDHPRALQEITEEHVAIRKRKGPEEAIDWNDYKSMQFTRAVILETSRLATVVNGVMRKTATDVELNGTLDCITQRGSTISVYDPWFAVPKGWSIYVYVRESNYDPMLYPEPLSFNPWRWQDKSLESHNYCFLFGGGSRLCPGKEWGLVKISMFLHYFLTRYRWEIVGNSEIREFPRVEAPNGLHIRVSKYDWGFKE